MRFLYSLLFYLALPFILLRLGWRSLRQPAYRSRLKERFGYYPFRLKKCFWIHAVSVGEVIAATPLIKTLKQRYPQIPLLITTMTPTGAMQVQKSLGEQVKHVYLPYDLPDAMKRFLQAMQPIIAIIMETELWPTLLAACHQQNIPVCLMNGRLSAKSARAYQRISSLTRSMLQPLALIASHASKDAARFIALGAQANRVIVTGSIKFDLALPNLTQESAALRAMLGNRPIWIAASTHKGEEEIIIAAHHQLRQIHPQALLILVPRHPQRFDAVFKLCQAHFSTIRRSQSQSCFAETGIYLGDTMGELLLLYSVA